MKRREELDKYRDMGDDELRAEAARLRESLFRLNFKLALGEVDAVKRIRQEKKALARIQTISTQRATSKRLELRNVKKMAENEEAITEGASAAETPQASSQP